jgi:hypothetical protein
MLLYYHQPHYPSTSTGRLLLDILAATSTRRRQLRRTTLWTSWNMVMLHPGGQLRRQWNSYFDYRYKFLYRYVNGQYYQYELFDTRFITGFPTPWKPNDFCVPVTIHETSRDCWSLTQPPALPTHPKRLPIATTFEEYLQRLPTKKKRKTEIPIVIVLP